MDPIETQRRFDGFRNTPLLWEGELEGMNSFSTKSDSLLGYPQMEEGHRIRFGKLMEQFVFYELAQDSSIQQLTSNIQVFEGKETIGELDCLFQQGESNIHLEIVFKFYLYDPNITSELDRWIGPNRKDTLVLKLNKLKEKQLPLLHFPQTVRLLDTMGLNAKDFCQQVHFRAQLFLPWNSKQSSCPFVNPDCITGFYLRKEEVKHFEDHQFYIPPKFDWVVEPHPAVDWLSYDNFMDEVNILLEVKRSPLCWMKSKEGEMRKFFVVFAEWG